MKATRPVAACLLASSAISLAELENEIPLGIEVVTGYRSEYIQRGFKRSGRFLDVQAGAELALTNDLMLGFGGWFGTATGSASYEEAAAFANLQWAVSDTLIADIESTWLAIDDPFFESGLDLAASLSWNFHDDLDLAAGSAWNTGADGLHLFTEIRWSKTLHSSGFINAETGISWVDSYYGRDGFNDAYASLSYTQVINSRVSLTPFAGTSVPLQSGPQTTRLFGGLWFEVNF